MFYLLLYSLLIFLTTLEAVAADVQVLTQRGNNQRTGVNTQESTLNQANVRAHFGKLWTLFADAKVMAQPLYVSKLVVPAANAFSPAAKAQCPSGCNAVIFGTMKGTVFAYLADQKATTQNDTLIWARFLEGDPRTGGNDIDMWGADDPFWGILGTPVIDLASQLIYVVTWNKDNAHRLYALDLASGKTKKGPVVINGTVNGTQFFVNGQQHRKQRSALLLDHGLLYVPFGGDNPGMAGWLFVYDAATLGFRTVWSPIPGGPNGGIWMSGGGLIADTDGSLYLQTANGDFNSNAAKWGNALLRLKMNGNQIQVTDFFAPCNTAMMNGMDMDLGSAGPLLLPGNLVSAGGKPGTVYLMERNHLGHFQAGGAGCNDSNLVLQRVNATPGHIHGTPVLWQGPGSQSWVYVMGEGDRLKAFPFENGRLKTGAGDIKVSGWKPPRPTLKNGHNQVPDNWMPGGTITVSSKAQEAGTGIVWVVSPANGDANSFRGVKGMLIAFNADNVADELWRSQGADSNADTANSMGLLARFAPVTVANGKVFVGNAGDHEPLFGYNETNRPHNFPANFAVVVYGLK